jgi:hypothetical protein
VTRYPLASQPHVRHRVRRDNLALVPGDLLPCMAQWQEIANQLPRHAILVVLPSGLPVQKQTMLSVAKLLAAEGRQVRVVPMPHISR